MRRTAIFFSLSLSCALPAVAATCPGKPVYQESFTKPNPAWVVAANENTKTTLDGGKYTIQLLSNNYTKSVLYQADVYDDVNVCVTVQSADKDKPDKRAAGIEFWAKDYSSYYLFTIDTGGGFGVSRWTGGRWINPLPVTVNAAVKAGPGAVNNLRVQMKGETATFFVNDTQVGQINGHPIDGGSQVGFYGDSATNNGDIWVFTDFSVMKP